MKLRVHYFHGSVLQNIVMPINIPRTKLFKAIALKRRLLNKQKMKMTAETMK